MCFELKKINGKKPLPKRATRNITVYKRLLKSSGKGPIYHLNIEGTYEGYTKGWYYYLKSGKPFLPDGMSDCENSYIGGNCFHSYVSLKRAKAYSNIWERVVEMIIPKGALYYKNDVHYVSDQIIYI